MAIDTGIYANLLRPPKSVAEYDQEAQASQLNALNIQQGRMKADEYTRGVAAQNALLQAVRGFGADTAANGNALLQTGNIKAFQDYQKSLDDRGESRAKIGKDTAQTAGYKLDQSVKLHEFQVQKLGSVSNPQDAMAWAQDALQSGVFTPEQFQRGVQALQQASQSPQAFAQWKQQALQGGMSATEQVKAQAEQVKQAEQVRQFGVTSSETARAHRANEGIAGANLNISRERLGMERAAPKGEIVQTEQGPMLVDKRTGQSRPVVGPDGSTLGPKLKDAPAAVQKAMIENGTNLRRAEKALALVEGKEIGGVKGDKNATGLKGFLPNQVLNRIDPDGVDTRAQIADLGSLVIHDRSGAAVTAAEFPRLAPFIPSEKDDAATVKKKVARFVQVYREEMEASQAAYGPDSGYRQLGGAPKPAGFDADKERRYQEWKAKQQ